MANLYLMDLQPFEKGRWRELLPALSSERQQKAISYRFEPDKARAAGAGWLLQYALTQAGIPVEAQILSKGKQGKPYLEHFPQTHFSLSHSGRWVVCAVSSDPVGVDVELPRCTMDIGLRFFRPDELEGLDRLPFVQQRDQLNRLWTAKEAFVKALGGGLTIPLNSFLVRLREQGSELEQSLSPLPYRLHEYKPDTSRICLCTTEDRPELLLVEP